MFALCNQDFILSVVHAPAAGGVSSVAWTRRGGVKAHKSKADGLPRPPVLGLDARHNFRWLEDIHDTRVARLVDESNGREEWTAMGTDVATWFAFCFGDTIKP